MGIVGKFMNFLGLQEEEEILEEERIAEGAHFEAPVHSERKNGRGNIVGLPTQRPIKMILTEPRSYEETAEIADHLRSRRPVVINLQRVRPEQAMRIVDFLSGTVYALNGGISKVGPNIFLCTPDTIEIQGAITDMPGGDVDDNPRTR